MEVHMLLSMMSTTSAMAPSALSTNVAMSEFASAGVADARVVAVLCMIVLISALEILSASKLWNKNLSLSLNLAILPLTVTFFAIVAFNIIKLL
jgi:hypothetical protein